MSDPTWRLPAASYQLSKCKESCEKLGIATSRVACEGQDVLHHNGYSSQVHSSMALLITALACSSCSIRSSFGRSCLFRCIYITLGENKAEMLLRTTLCHKRCIVAFSMRMTWTIQHALHEPCADRHSRGCFWHSPDSWSYLLPLWATHHACAFPRLTPVHMIFR